MLASSFCHVFSFLFPFPKAFLGENSSQLEAVYNQAGEHAFLTADVGSTCTFAGEPFINACNYDAAGALLQHLHMDTLVAPSKGAAPSGLDAGNLFEFDQVCLLVYTQDVGTFFSCSRRRRTHK